ncbi:hypothetical protein EVA_09391 [gut metagenome]|uniref:Uncharacterized protein n=1 Tax=gut metagenome TaxID=749906 RepID=J9GK85_9ZZZZ
MTLGNEAGRAQPVGTRSSVCLTDKKTAARRREEAMACLAAEKCRFSIARASAFNPGGMCRKRAQERVALNLLRFSVRVSFFPTSKEFRPLA